MKYTNYLLAATAALSLTAIALPNVASAGRSYKELQTVPVYVSNVPHWYASANLGVSHLFDKKTPGSTNSVDQNGPGFNVNVGYQYTTMIGEKLVSTIITTPEKRPLRQTSLKPNTTPPT